MRIVQNFGFELPKMKFVQDIGFGIPKDTPLPMKIVQNFGFGLLNNTPQMKIVQDFRFQLPKNTHLLPKNENYSGLWISACQEYPSPPKMKIAQDFDFELHKNTPPSPPQWKLFRTLDFSFPRIPPSRKWEIFRTLDLSLPRIPPPQSNTNCQDLCAGDGCVETNCYIPHGYRLAGFCLPVRFPIITSVLAVHFSHEMEAITSFQMRDVWLWW